MDSTVVHQSAARRSQSVRNSAQAQPLRHLRGDKAIARAAAAAYAMESLETRRLLAVTFNFPIADLGGTYRPYYNEIRNVLFQAGKDWSAIFDDSVNASIEIEVHFQNSQQAGSDSIIAFALPVELQKTSTNSSDVDIVDPGPLYEIKTGTDPNGQQPDAIITFNADFFAQGFFSTDLDRVVPSNKIDVLSVATHEIGHTVGFTSTRTTSSFFDPDTGRFQITSFSNLLDSSAVVGKTSRGDDITGLGFTGAAAQSVYGFAVPVSLTTGAHYGSNDKLNSTQPGFDLRFNLMNPFGYSGRKATITAIDAAFLADMGANVKGTFDALPSSGPVLTINGTTADDVIEVIATGNQYVIKRNFVTTTESFPIEDYTSVVVNALGGNDRILISGSVPAVVVNAGAGNDTVIGGTGDDTINGGSGADLLFGYNGNDIINGDGGNDNIYGGEGADRLFGGTGVDFMLGEAGNDLMDGGNDNDSLDGGSGSDKLFGGAGNDTVYGGSSRDTLNGGSGADLLQGGGGEADFADYSDRTAPLSLSIDDKANDGEAGEGDNIDGKIEVIVGGSGADHIGGNGKNNTLYGGDGDDTMDGGAGDDYLEGGSGADRMAGGSGNDSLLGGGGKDHLVGGPGGDRLFGQNGNDLFYSKDGESDSLEGGDGNDRYNGDSIEELLSVEGTF